MNLTKISLITLLICSSFKGSSQATSSSDFKLTVGFTKDIPVSKLKVWYYEKRGNHIEKVSYSTDTVNNKIILSGHNSYVVLVSFPTLVFSLSNDEIPEAAEEPVERQYNFYLATNDVSSYGLLSSEPLFSKQYSNILISRKNHSDTPRVIREETIYGIGFKLKDAIFLSNKTVKVNKQ